MAEALTHSTRPPLDADRFFAILYAMLVPLVAGLAAYSAVQGLQPVVCGPDSLGAVTSIPGSWEMAAALAALLALGSWGMYLYRPNSQQASLYNGAAAMGFCALIMHFGGGSGEAHFPFFILTSFLLAYRDWRPILVATAVICVHHLLVFWWQVVGGPVILFHCLDVETLLIHLLFGAGQGAMLCYIALVMRRQAEAQNTTQRILSESEHRFHTLFDYSPDPMWIIADGTFVDCNAAAVIALGYQQKSQVLNRSPVSFSPPVQPDGQPSQIKAVALFEEARNHGRCRFEWEHVRADGVSFPVEVTLCALLLEDMPVYYCSWRDISERRQAEESQRLASIVVQNASEGIMVTDASSTILSINPAFSRITGYSEAEMVGHKPNILRSQHHDDGFYNNLWHSLLQKGHWEGEIWNRRKDGSLYIQRQTITAVKNSNDEITSYVSVFSDITEMRRSEDRIRHLAYHDALTGLPNRALLLDRLGNAIGRSKRQDVPLAVMFLDLDHFKTINDTLGHDVGDALLVETSKRISSCLRSTDTVARMGGDEFVILLEPCGAADDVARVAEKIIFQVSQPLQLRKDSLTVTTSVGIALFPQDGQDVNGLLKRADTAMYASKAGGRNAFRFFESQMTEQTVARLHLERDLRQAIESESFELYYQPKFSLVGQECRGSEALIRWHHPERGMVSPVEFIPLAEETGLIVPLGDWVLETACAQIALWQNTIPALLPLAVNVSTKQLLSGDPVERILSIVRKHHIRPEFLQVEITESVVMSDPVRAADILNRLRQEGITIAIDDFGTGYSSLSYLTKFPIDVIKIDRSFVTAMRDGRHNVEIINAIIGLGHSLGMSVVAEGIENEQEVAMLADAQCPIGQGYLFARPMPSLDLAHWAQRTEVEAEP